RVHQHLLPAQRHDARADGFDRNHSQLGFHAFAFNQRILTSFSTALNSGSPVTSSALCLWASAAAKASARLKLTRDLKSAARSASSRVAGWNSIGRAMRILAAASHAAAPSLRRIMYLTSA